MTASEFQRWYALLPEAMLLVASDGEVLASNAAAVELLGPAIGANLLDLTADEPQRLRAFLNHCLRTRQFTLGVLTVRRGGAELPHRAEGALFVPADGSRRAQLLLRLTPKERATSRFLALNSRIEALQKEIAERQRAQAALYAQREWLRTTLASIGDAVVATDGAGRVAFMNAVAEQLTGWTQQDASGKDLAEVFHIVNEDTRDIVQSPVDKVLRDGGIVGLANHTVLLAKDGIERPIDDSGAPIRDQRGQIVGVVLVFRDVSERRLAEQALMNSNRSLLRTNESLRQFAYAAAHDLKEPLRTVSLYSQVLRRRYSGKLDSKADEFLTYMHQGAERMQLLVHDLLAFTEAGETLEKPPSPVSLSAALQRALANLSLAISESHAVVTSDPMPNVMAHEVTMVQLFQNLLGNAIKYRKRDEAPRIHIAAERKPFGWILSISDNGVGIPRKYHDYIFGIFRRLSRDQKSGTGIGLAICQRVIEGYGGNIWVESEEGRGSTFYFTLPAAGEALPAGSS